MDRGEQAKPTARIEEYLESILNMLSEGMPVQAIRLAERLSVAPPTVAGALRRMRRDGLIVVGPRKEISLTEEGTRQALSIVRRHRLVERLLTDVLGVEWYQAHDEACLMEHGISGQVEARLRETLGRPATCPHGNPIPGGESLPRAQGVPLDSISAGTQVRVERISEEAERNIELLKFLHRNGIVPGASFQVKEIAAYAGTITLARQSGETSLGLGAASSVWVTPQS